jgi:hypothetical protein
MTRFQIILLAFVVFLLGIFVAREFERGSVARAEVAGSNGHISAFAPNMEGGEAGMVGFYMVFPSDQKVLAYKMKNGELMLLGARSYKYDTWCPDTFKSYKWGQQGVSMKEAKEAQEKYEKEKAKKGQ